MRAQWNVNLVGSQDGYFTPEQREALFARIAASGAAIVTVAMGSPKQEIFMRDCRKFYPDALYMGLAALTMFSPAMSNVPPKFGRIWGWSGYTGCWRNPAAFVVSLSCLSLLVIIIVVVCSVLFLVTPLLILTPQRLAASLS